MFAQMAGGAAGRATGRYAAHCSGEQTALERMSPYARSTRRRVLAAALGGEEFHAVRNKMLKPTVSDTGRGTPLRELRSLGAR